MRNPTHIQIKLTASPAQVFQALTDSQELSKWFTESCDVSLEQGRYDFWGRYSPGTPDQSEGHHPLLAAEPERYLKYSWRLQGADSTVEIRLTQHNNATLLVLEHHNIDTTPDMNVCNLEDFWLLTLENLRRYLDGKSIVRCDFSAFKPGDIKHTIDIDGPREKVFEALIRPEQLERWIASRATVEPHEGGALDIGWTGVGAFKILELVPNEKLSYTWPEETPSVLTWQLEGSGGRTRLTMVHSGFAPDKDTDGLQAGWLNFISWIKSLVEYGPEWYPAILRISQEEAPFYAGIVWAKQPELIEV